MWVEMEGYWIEKEGEKGICMYASYVGVLIISALGRI